MVNWFGSVYLCYNFFSDQFLLMDKGRADKLEDNDYLGLEKEYPDFYAQLMDGDLLVEDDFDELSISLHKKIACTWMPRVIM